MMRLVSFVLLGLAKIAEAESIEAGCDKNEGADDSALLTIRAGANTSRALLSKRGSYAEGVFCNRFVEHVCPTITPADKPVDSKKQCKWLKNKKGPMKKACKTFFYKEPYLYDPVGYKSCKKLAKAMSKSCENKVKSNGVFVVDDCKSTLERKYQCIDFCGEFVSSVCPKVAVGTANKKSCKAISKKGKQACKSTFGKNPKKNIAKHSKQCQKIMKPMETACKDTTLFDEEACENVLYENYNCNPCAGQKPTWVPYFDNVECVKQGVLQSLEQSGINITQGYEGDFNTNGRVPITGNYASEGLCPVNVHWHLGTEHYSLGEFDEAGSGPPVTPTDPSSPFYPPRAGYKCHFYNGSDPKFTTPYDWKYCKDIYVGETYEVHWPHSGAGDCGTKWQYQSPFYDGVFCNGGIISLDPLNTYKEIGVQGQIFTIVNDESYHVPDLIKGMVVNGAFGTDVAKYTGSTTGESRSNTICSRYTPITWQVDRKCHLISASSFDEMCEAMMNDVTDNMYKDTYPHGSRELVIKPYAADNVQLVQERL